MKALFLLIITWLLATACNNSGDSDKKKDSVNIDVNTGTTTDHSYDTTSYDRMPDKMTDSTP
jgi:hypothetical protein